MISYCLSLDGYKCLAKYLDQIVARRYVLSICLLASAMFAISVAVRCYGAAPVDLGGDAVSKWQIIRVAIENGFLSESASHHVMRWAINIPVLIVQMTFGDAPSNYYIWPIFSASVTAVFLFLLGERVANWRWGILLATFFMTSSHVIRSGSQFLPMGPATMYMIGALYFLTLYLQNSRIRFLLLSAGFYFCSYGAKVTAIYYLPAFILLVLMGSTYSLKAWKKNLKPLVFFISFLLLLFVVESLALYEVTNYPTRLSALKAGVHGDNWEKSRLLTRGLNEAKLFFNESPYATPPYPDEINWRSFSVSLWQYSLSIFNYLQVDRGGVPRFLLYISAIFAIIIIANGKKKLYIVALPYLLGFFAHSYAITSLEPFMRPERMLLRYFALVYLLSSIVAVLFFWDKYRESDSVKFKSGVLILVVGMSILQYVDWANKIPHHNGIIHAQQNQLKIEKARENGQAILVPAQPYKIARGYAALYWQSKQLENDPDSLMLLDVKTGKFLNGKDLPKRDDRRINYKAIVELNGNDLDNVIYNHIKIKMK